MRILGQRTRLAIAALAVGVGVAFIGWALAELQNLRRSVARLEAASIKVVPMYSPPPPTQAELDEMLRKNSEAMDAITGVPTAEQMEKLHAAPHDGHGWMIGPDGKARHIPDGP